MLRLSLNLLTNAVHFLNEVESDEFGICTTLLYEKAEFFWGFSVDRDALLDVVSICKWIASENNSISLTKRGMEILSNKSFIMTPKLLRLMLEDYITGAKPIWRNRIPYGRKEAAIFMTKDEKACFQEAGLLIDSPTKDVVSWWDHISEIVRNEKQNAMLTTGRTGEEYTLQYEQWRTNNIPQWISIDSNLAGYDILSKVSKNNNSTLLIEVKTSTEDMENACFYISRNEWNVASSTCNYQFYLWHISSSKKLLAVISPEMVAGHIPLNRLSGEWESVCIPFSAFKMFFNEVL